MPIDNQSPPQDSEPPLGHYLVIGALETFANATLSLDAATVAALQEHTGTVIKLKIREPYRVFYLILEQDGVEVRDEYPGKADIRIITSLGALANWAIGRAEDPHAYPKAIQIWGNPDKIRDLGVIFHNFNLRTAFSKWLRENIHLPTLLTKIREHDSSWIRDLAPIPSLIRDALEQLRTLNATLAQQQEDLARFKSSVARQRALDLAYLLLAFLAIMAAVVQSSSSMSLADLMEMPANSWLLVLTALALVLSRIGNKP